MSTLQETARLALKELAKEAVLAKLKQVIVKTPVRARFANLQFVLRNMDDVNKLKEHLHQYL